MTVISMLPVRTQSGLSLACVTLDGSLQSHPQERHPELKELYAPISMSANQSQMLATDTLPAPILQAHFPAHATWAILARG